MQYTAVRRFTILPLSSRSHTVPPRPLEDGHAPCQILRSYPKTPHKLVLMPGVGHNHEVMLDSTVGRSVIYRRPDTGRGGQPGWDAGQPLGTVAGEVSGQMVIFELVYLTLTMLWLGSMIYSLVVVQPKIAKFFRDNEQREEFLVVLAHGNRWPVAGLIVGLVLSGGAVALAGFETVSAGYTVAVGLDLVAAGIFVDVSWRHWPARIFALTEELPGFRRRLTLRATTMTALIGVSYVVAVAISLR